MRKFTALSLEQYLQELSSENAVPGGGSVSAYAASLALGLMQMVAGIARKRKKKTAMTPEEEADDNLRRETLQKVHEALEGAKGRAFAIVDSDPEAYDKVMAAWDKPKALEAALAAAYRMQADLCEIIVEGRRHLSQLMGLVTGSIKNDLIVSSALLKAAFQGAYHTANINVVYMKDKAAKEQAEKTLEDLKGRFEGGQADAG
jgi:formiminotetrahydrofolate cyclodeaminase